MDTAPPDTDGQLKSLKICDFNHARVCRQGQDYGVSSQKGAEDVELSGHVGTQPYIAPEVMLFEGKYGKSMDVWSMGCIYGELFTKSRLFPGSSDEDQISKIIQTMGFPKDFICKLVQDKFGSIHGDVFRENMQDRLQSLWDMRNDMPSRDWESVLPNAPGEAISMITSLLQFNPQNRITAADCLWRASQMHPHHPDHALQDESPRSKIDWPAFDDPSPSQEHLHKWLDELEEWARAGGGNDLLWSQMALRGRERWEE